MTKDKTVTMSRELAERLAHILYMHDAENTDAATELEALIAAPVVERQEPVAWQYRVSAGPATGWSLWHDGKGEEFRNSYQVETRALYTSPPAPVAVVLPEQCENKLVSAHYRNGWNACLDKFKELNQ